MTLSLQSPPVPLRTDEDGIVRVANTRVTLDTIVQAFHQGATAEEIAQQYSAISLADIYAVIGFYLSQRQQVDAYLFERAQLAQQIREKNEARFSPNGVRERLLSRKQSRSAGK